jgi:hypothetical protein
MACVHNLHIILAYTHIAYCAGSTSLHTIFLNFTHTTGYQMLYFFIFILLFASIFTDLETYVSHPLDDESFSATILIKNIAFLSKMKLIIVINY